MARFGSGALAASLLLLGACELAPVDHARSLSATPVAARAEPRGLAEALEPDAAWEAYLREAERSFAEAPFERGAMDVVAREGGFPRTFRLAPCPARRTVCAGSADGPAGTLELRPAFFVVRGLYGRTFWLSYGGDGYVQRGDTLWSLAWNARADGPGEGPGPLPAEGDQDGSALALETDAPHR